MYREEQISKQLDNAHAHIGRMVIRLNAIIFQLQLCGFTCEAGRLEDNIAWKELVTLAGMGWFDEQ